jgi:hypothetical protein
MILVSDRLLLSLVTKFEYLKVRDSFYSEARSKIFFIRGRRRVLYSRNYG